MSSAWLRQGRKRVREKMSLALIEVREEIISARLRLGEKLALHD
jgi:hypothetical protein